MFDDLDQARAPTGSAQADHRVLYRRWRPVRFEDVVGQEHVTRTLRNAVRLDRIAHAYLFTGPRGTGKTSLARILYRAINCLHPEDGEPDNTCPICQAALEGRALDLVEIDAASNRGIDDMRDLRDKVAYRPTDGRYRLYIIDEAHELTTFAWDAFLKTLEEPPAHAVFVLATTEAHGVPQTIVSRCQRFDFRRIPFAATRDQLARVAAAEGMRVEPAVLERLALVARGGLRDALSLLDQLAAFAAAQVTIDMDVARAVLSLPSVEGVRRVVDGLTRRDAAAVVADLDAVAAGGADLRLFTEELVSSLRAVLLARSRADARLVEEMPAAEADWLRARAPGWTVGALIALIQQLSSALARTRDAQQFQIQVELALLAACDLPSALPLAPAPLTAPPAPPSAPPATPPVGPASISSPPAPPAPTPVAATPSPAEDTSAAAADLGEPPVMAAPPAAEPSASAESSGTAVESAESSGAAQAPVAVEAEMAAAADSPGLATGPSTEPGHAEAAAQQRAAAEAEAEAELAVLKSRWPDVVEHVTSRKRMLGVLMSSARPLGLEDGRLVIGFESEFSLKRAEQAASRHAIEESLRHVLGRSYRLRCRLTSGLLDDPVIGYAVRAFGGHPQYMDPPRADQA